MSAKSVLSPRAAIAVVLWGLQALAGSAHAQDCDVTLVRAPEEVRIAYDPFSLTRIAGRIDLQFANGSAEPCDLEIVVLDDVQTPVSEVRPGGVEVEFRPREGAAVTRDSARPGVFSFQLPAKSEFRAELDALPVGDAIAEAGEHQVDIRVEVRRRQGDPLLPQFPLRVLLVAPPRAQVNVAGAAGAFGSGSTVEVIDFGDAVTGAVKRAFLQIRANTRATVTFVSEHEGVMRHVELGEKVPPFPYAVALDGAPLDLSKPIDVEVETPRTLAGTSLPLDFTLGELAGQVAGRYQDVITIDITPG